MDTHQTDIKDIPELATDTLIQSALENTLNAINGYDAILWKIRTGYLAILYGGLALILGKDSLKYLGAVAGDLGLSFSIFFII